MTGSLNFQFATPMAWLLAAGLLLALVVLRERWRRGGGKEKKASERLRGVTLALQGMVLLAGLAMACWPLLRGDAEPWSGPMLPLGLSLLMAAALLAPATLAFVGVPRSRLRYPAVATLEAVAAGRPPGWRYLAPLLRLVALGLLVVALARPQVSSTEADVFTEGMDIVLTLDVSTSMEAVDFAPPSRPGERQSRIRGAREVVSQFVRQRKNDRLALVVFAAEAFTQCPLTLDYSVLQNILSSVRTGAIDDGTAIGDAILVSLNRLEQSEAKSKVIVLITDGDDNASRVSPQQAADIATEKGVIIFPIMVGKGGKVPYPIGKDLFGQVQYGQVEIRTNPELLKSIAEKTGGKFYLAVDEQALAEDLQDILDHMEKSRLMDPGRFTRHTEVFQLAVLGALLALLVEAMLSWTRLRAFP